MRLLLSATTLLLSASTFAQTASVKITSFYFLTNGSRAAELCGAVTGGNGNEMVQVNVDPHAKTPGHYFSATAADGSFCLMVATQTGEATAGVKGQAAQTFARVQ